MNDFKLAKMLLAGYNTEKWNLLPPEIKHILINEFIEFRNLLVNDGGIMSARGMYQQAAEKVEKKLLEVPHTHSSKRMTIRWVERN